MATRTEKTKLWDKYREGLVIDLEDGCTHPVKMRMAELTVEADANRRALLDEQVKLGKRKLELEEAREQLRVVSLELSAKKELLEQQYELVARYREQLAEQIEAEADDSS
jgi:hypothetical protein